MKQKVQARVSRKYVDCSKKFREKSQAMNDWQKKYIRC